MLFNCNSNLIYLKKCLLQNQLFILIIFIIQFLVLKVNHAKRLHTEETSKCLS